MRYHALKSALKTFQKLFRPSSFSAHSKVEDNRSSGPAILPHESSMVAASGSGALGSCTSAFFGPQETNSRLASRIRRMAVALRYHVCRSWRKSRKSQITTAPGLDRPVWRPGGRPDSGRDPDGHARHMAPATMVWSAGDRGYVMVGHLSW